MKIAKYKRGLVSQNPREFCDTLKELRDDLKLEKNIYSAIKRINKFLCKTIEEIDKTEIIENDLYRIIPFKYSFIYMLAIAFQTEVEVCEQDIVIYKRKEMYSRSKRMGKSPENICEIIIIEKIIPAILQSIENTITESMDGFENIYEIDSVIKESNLIKALSRIDILQKQEYNLRCKQEDDFLKDDIITGNIIDDMDKHFSEMAKNKRLMIESELGSILLKSKITILHIPLCYNYSVIYLNRLNTFVIARCSEDETKENAILSGFGLYLRYKVTEDADKLPFAFKLSEQASSLKEEQQIFSSLFAYKLMEGTPLECKNFLINEFRHSLAMIQIKQDARYFDVLVK